MKVSYHYPLLFSCLLFSILLSATSESSFGVWFGLELNMISFICFIMLSRHHSTTSEVALKYFLVQAPASFVFLLNSLLPNKFFPEGSTILAMSLKAGVAPFHFWLPQISESLSWSQLSILLTIQKVIPLFILASWASKSPPLLLFLLITFSAIVGSVGGLNETSLRKLMAFSSISHLSWMLTCMIITSCSWLHYWGLYSFVILTLFMALHGSQACHITQMWLGLGSSPCRLSIATSLLSLMGLPPLLGFVPKLMVIYSATTGVLLMVISILVISSGLTLYYYLRMLMTFSYQKLPSKFVMTRSLLPQLMLPLIINSSGLILLPMGSVLN